MNSVIHYLLQTATRCPDNVAVSDGTRELTYAGLLDESQRLGTALLDLPPGPVVVWLPKSVDSLCAFMGALLSGRAYAPLDYATPLPRLAKTLRHMQPAAVITDAAGREQLLSLELGDCCALVFADLLLSAPDAARLEAAVDAVIDADPCYIMHTSGSTGTPKGVVVPHRGVEDYCQWLIELFHIDEHSVLGLQSGFHFDNSVFDIYTCLATGARLEIIPEVLFMYPAQLLDLLRERGVTCVFWVPTVMIAVANSGALAPGCLPALQTVVFAGEVMPNSALNVWRAALPGCVFANLYGPTEITVDCTCYIVDRQFADSDPLPIGRSRPNMRVLLLKDDGSAAAPGEEGEICVLGSAVALGYWDAPEQTAAVFTACPLTPQYDQLMYRTGDIGRCDTDGNIMYMGRRDSQFKLRGNRIELGDIETAARCVDGVDNACALFDAEREEIALFVQSALPLTLRKLNVELGRQLPKYMLPRRLVVLAQLPLTPNRKIDRVLLCQQLKEETI